MSVHEYQFPEPVNFPDVEASLLLALWAAEALYGPVAVRIEAAHEVHEEERRIVIDCQTPAGRTVSQIFLGFLSRELGETSFSFTRREALTPSPRSCAAP